MSQDESDGRLVRKLLVCVDHTPECRVALRYAARRARRTGDKVVMLCPIDTTEFPDWLGLAGSMREDAKIEAEELMAKLSQDVELLAGSTPETLVYDGRADEIIMKTIADDPAIRLLILGASTEKEGPGPVVHMLVEQQTTSMRVPITVVPGNLSAEMIEALD